MAKIYIKRFFDDDDNEKIQSAERTNVHSPFPLVNEHERLFFLFPPDCPNLTFKSKKRGKKVNYNSASKGPKFDKEPKYFTFLDEQVEGMFLKCTRP